MMQISGRAHAISVLHRSKFIECLWFAKLGPFELGHRPAFSPGHFQTIERFRMSKECGGNLSGRKSKEAKYKWLFSRSGLILAFCPISNDKISNFRLPKFESGRKVDKSNYMAKFRPSIALVR
jgi:hypothetical protein